MTLRNGFQNENIVIFDGFLDNDENLIGHIVQLFSKLYLDAKSEIQILNRL